METAQLSLLPDTLDRYMSEINRLPLLSRDEENTLARRWRDHQDIDAAHKLTCGHLRFVVKIANEYRSYGMRLLDLIRAIADQPDDVGDALGLQHLGLVLGKRPARDLDQRFRDRLGDGPQPGGQSAGENCNRQVHASRTLVPSKSNRKRTSSSPALAIACRTRR